MSFPFPQIPLLYPYFITSNEIVVDSIRKSNFIAPGIDAFPAVNIILFINSNLEISWGAVDFKDCSDVNRFWILDAGQKYKILNWMKYEEAVKVEAFHAVLPLNFF